MNSALTFLLHPLLLLLLLRRCCCAQTVSFSMAFSAGTQLLVHVADEDDGALHPQNKTSGPAASVQIFRPVRRSQDPASPRLLVCLLSGLSSPVQDVRWWVDGIPVTATEAPVSWEWSEVGGAYRATSVLEVSAADWRSGSTYECGTIQGGQEYRQELCSGD